MRYLGTVLLLVLSLGVYAEEKNTSQNYFSKYIEGVDYQRLDSPVNTITKDKIEVTEAFSYLCGHCYNFEPLIIKWHQSIAKDVELVKLPVVFQPSMEHYARIMYTAQALNILDEASAVVFKAIHIDKQRLISASKVSALFEPLGISAEKFSSTFNSFGVDSQVRKASARTRAMKIASTPQMVVDGRFSVSATREFGHEGMLKVVDFLVAKVRAERSFAQSK